MLQVLLDSKSLAAPGKIAAKRLLAIRSVVLEDVGLQGVVVWTALATVLAPEQLVMHPHVLVELFRELEEDSANIALFPVMLLLVEWTDVLVQVAETVNTFYAELHIISFSSA